MSLLLCDSNWDNEVSQVVLVVWSVYSDTNLASPLLEFDLDEQNEANQRHNHEESQEDAHVKIFRGLLWKRRATETQICQIISTCSWLKGLQTGYSA